MNLPCSFAPLAPQQPQKAFLLLLCSWQQLHRFCAALYIQTDTDLQAPGFFFRIFINNMGFGIAEYTNDICLTCVALIGESPGRGLSNAFQAARSKMCTQLCWLGMLGHCDRRKKQLSHTAKMIAFAYSSAKAEGPSPPPIEVKGRIPVVLLSFGSKPLCKGTIFQ